MRTRLGHATKGGDSLEATLGFLFKDEAVSLKEPGIPGLLLILPHYELQWQRENH